MIAWGDVERRLARLVPAGGLLSVAVPLPALPQGLPAAGDWFHWRRPDEGLRFTAIGSAAAVESGGTGRFAALAGTHRGLLAAWRRDDGAAAAGRPLAWGGFAFSPTGGQPLPNACLTVPALLLAEDSQGAWATFSCAADDAPAAPARWRRLWEGAAAAPEQLPPAIERLPSPVADRAFLARGRAALAAIGRGELQKLVLTRHVGLRAAGPLSPLAVLDALAEANPACAVWARRQGEALFLGASPERLLSVAGDAVEVDALAATAWSSSALSIRADKNLREQGLVAEAVREALSPLCRRVSVPEAAEVLRVGGIEHLRQRILAERRDAVGVYDLLAALHPTPAVNGTPAKAAGEWLAAHGDQRGAWYTGGVGWLDGEGDADFAVALRCGLLLGREITLYAGAGFVAGSDPEAELAETEVKLAPMLAALRAGRAAARAIA